MISSIITVSVNKKYSNKDTAFVKGERKPMRLQTEGFLVLEVMVLFVLLTVFILICMQYHSHSLTLHAEALTTMKVINRLEDMLDTFEKEQKVTDLEDDKFTFHCSIDPIAMPSVYGQPHGFTLNTVFRMKVITMSTTWIGRSGVNACCMSLIFKEKP